MNQFDFAQPAVTLNIAERRTPSLATVRSMKRGHTTRLDFHGANHREKTAVGRTLQRGVPPVAGPPSQSEEHIPRWRHSRRALPAALSDLRRACRGFTQVGW